MAIIKHIAMKSGNYTGAIHYLLFQHDEFTQEEIVDDYGVPVLREEYYFDGINCEPYAFDYECADLNRKFHKNCSRDEIKQHHYTTDFQSVVNARRSPNTQACFSHLHSRHHFLRSERRARKTSTGCFPQGRWSRSVV